MSYNGWKNYETWNVALWLDNGGAGEQFRDQALGMMQANDGDKDEVERQLADMLQEHHEEAMPEVSGCFADILNAAMRDVDWHEIAAHYIDDCGYEPESTDDEEDAA